MSLNIILHVAFLNIFTCNFVSKFYSFIFGLFSSDTLQVLIFVCPIVSELRFSGFYVVMVFLILIMSKVCNKYDILFQVFIWRQLLMISDRIIQHTHINTHTQTPHTTMLTKLLRCFINSSHYVLINAAFI